MKRVLVLFMLTVMFVFSFNIIAFASIEAFGYCGENLTWTVIWDNGKYVLDIKGEGNMYDYSYQKTQADRPPWHEYRGKITQLVLSENITSIGAGAFYGTEIDNIDLPEKLTSINDYAFYCSNIQSITIPDTVMHIGNNAFSGCSHLEEIYIPESVNSLGEGVFSQSAIRYASIAGEVLFIPKDTFKQCRSLENVVINEGICSVEEEAFYECTALKNIDIPSSLTRVEKRAFYYCNALENATYHAGPSKLKQVAFDIQNHWLENKIKCYGTGKCGENLSWSYLSGKLTISGYGDMYNYEKQNTPWINYSEDISNIVIGTSVNSIGNEAFKNTSIGQITIPTSIKSIGDDAFIGCTNLWWIYVEGKNNNYYSAYGELLNKNKSILIKYPIKNPEKDYVIANTVVSIEKNAFRDSEITSVVIPRNVKYVGEYAFSGTCPDHIYYIGSEEEYKNINIQYGNEVLENKKNIEFLYGANMKILSFGKKVYSVGENIDISDLSICIQYADGIEEILNVGSDDIVVSGFDSTSPSDRQIITVNYKGLIDTFEVIIVQQGLPCTQTTVSDVGKSFAVTPINVEKGKNVILALYEDEKFVEMQSATYEGEAIHFTTDKTYTNAKVMVWDSLSNLKPICEVEMLK